MNPRLSHADLARVRAAAQTGPDDDVAETGPASLPLRLLLSFSNRDDEQKFSKFYNAFYYRYAQASLVVGALMIIGDVIADSLAYPGNPTNTLRLTSCLPILAAGLAFSFTQYARRRWQRVMAAFIVLVGASLFAVLLEIDRQGGMGLKSWVGILNFVFLQIYCFLILGIQFNFALAAGCGLLAIFEAIIVAGATATGPNVLYLSYHVVTLFLLAATIGWWREYVLRKEFLAKNRLKAAQLALSGQNAKLEGEVRKRTGELAMSQDAAILTLASLVETRDNETGNHVRRTQHYVRELARELRNHPKFAAALSEKQIETMFKSAPLHDIGKVGIPDHILRKPGRLEPDEFEIMKTHTTIGHQAIETAQRELGIKLDFLDCVQEIALNHHEKWDGSGYPRGLSGDAIPVSARLMAVADVYDALISERVYKKALSHDEAAAVIREGRGRHFDPDVVDAFFAIGDKITAIAHRFRD
ncbi:HD domain-containing protein [Rhodoblastus acidophilus]|uniref:HD domain-containing protein n=1 Tax=Rhodoblastus acidophilus TaxID=1074 RepID=A0A212RSV1_RHOAC|nr:HD domain-containing phosphohydrolase [Rhodoblastus acidophilus]SNB75602.1 HD domain-containing protein [Rhodoblastus acidophilus]